MHRVGRVLCLSPVVGIGLPHPAPADECGLPPVLGGGVHSLAREGWESPSSKEGTCTVVLFIFTYFVGLWHQLTDGGGGGEQLTAETADYLVASSLVA
jgi:hypothetical protein